MQKEVNIRDATADDLPAILEIYNDVILNTTAVYSEKPHTLQMRLDWYTDRVNHNFPGVRGRLRRENSRFQQLWPFQGVALLPLYG